ncbi:MAG: GLPGLI family protein [Bacteroidetes bacterium]|nr:GLPGLI family protein [Bacteroidota bacterium]
MLTVALLMLCTTEAHAQEGTVTYEETVKMEFELPPEMEHMREHIPSTRTATKLLFFNASASLMKDAQQEEEERGNVVMHGQGGLHFRTIEAPPGNETYVNFDEGQLIEKEDFLGRTFLITGETPTLAWRLTDERSEFLGYMAQKATAVRDSTTIEAWFTPEIPVPAGPGRYGGLPGLILVLNLNDGQTTYVAQELSLAPLDEAFSCPRRKAKR